MEALEECVAGMAGLAAVVEAGLVTARERVAAVDCDPDRPVCARLERMVEFVVPIAEEADAGFSQLRDQAKRLHQP